MELEDWYRAEHGRVLSSLTVLTGSLDEAREATDEAFARAIARWDQVATMDNPTGWVYRVAVNHARRRARRRDLEKRLLRREPPRPPTAGPAGEAWALVAELPPRQRQVVVLRHIADLTEPAIAEVLGIRRGTVASTLHDAHRTLRERLDAAGLPPTPAAAPTGSPAAGPPAPTAGDHADATPRPGGQP